MTLPGMPPTIEQLEALRRILDDPSRSEDDLRYDELPGFLFAIASAPILVKPSEWMPDVLGDGPAFESETEAQAGIAAIMARYSRAVAATQEGGPIDPEDVGIDVSSDECLRSWSRGFLAGFSGLHDAWQSALKLVDDEDREHFNAVVPVLLIWSDPDRYKETNGGGDEELKGFLETCRNALPAALGFLAELGVSIYRATFIQSQKQAVPTASVGRNDPCPCGSGKKYKRCCLVN